MCAGSDVLPEAAPHAALRRRLQAVELVVNPLAGSVGPGASEQAQQILREFGLEPKVRTPAPEELSRQLREAVDSRPDLLIILAGDGTARAAASLCGAEGPLLAPLAGGTMNLLPHALYGPKPWPEALREMLEQGVERPVSGGQADGQRFHVSAILGPPALWAEAREAVRVRRLSLAWRKAKLAWARSFRNHVTFALDGAPARRAEAVALICPLVSRALPDDVPLLEAAALRPRSAADAVRLGLHALLSEIIGDWRKDPAVMVMRRRSGVVCADAGHVHAILDGEPMRMGRQVEVGFVPVAFRALAPPRREPQTEVASAIPQG
jgi:diacylglycerol kinase family enzyme